MILYARWYKSLKWNSSLCWVLMFEGILFLHKHHSQLCFKTPRISFWSTYLTEINKPCHGAVHGTLSAAMTSSVQSASYSNVDFWWLWSQQNVLSTQYEPWKTVPCASESSQHVQIHSNMNLHIQKTLLTPRPHKVPPHAEFLWFGESLWQKRHWKSSLGEALQWSSAPLNSPH